MPFQPTCLEYATEYTRSKLHGYTLSKARRRHLIRLKYSIQFLYLMMDRLLKPLPVKDFCITLLTSYLIYVQVAGSACGWSVVDN